MNVYTLNGQVLTNDGKWLKEKEAPPVDPYNPLGLPSHTIRVRYAPGTTCDAYADSKTCIDEINNIWDVYNSSNNWHYMFAGEPGLVEVLGANTTGVTNMYYMFQGTNDSNMCQLTNINFNFDVSSLTNVSNMFDYCKNVEGGILDFYNRLLNESQVAYHTYCFRNCGANTVTGAAELAQIPSGWK